MNESQFSPNEYGRWLENYWGEKFFESGKMVGKTKARSKLDLLGIDLVVVVDRKPIFLQVKSSLDGARTFLLLQKTRIPILIGKPEEYVDKCFDQALKNGCYIGGNVRLQTPHLCNVNVEDFVMLLKTYRVLPNTIVSKEEILKDTDWY